MLLFRCYYFPELVNKVNILRNDKYEEDKGESQMKFEYLTHKIKALHTREGFVLDEDYEHYLNFYAQQGWRFVQFIDLTKLDPKNPHITLLFERKKGGK